MTDRRRRHSSHYLVRERRDSMSIFIRTSGLRSLVGPFRWNLSCGRHWVVLMASLLGWEASCQQDMRCLRCSWSAVRQERLPSGAQIRPHTVGGVSLFYSQDVALSETVQVSLTVQGFWRNMQKHPPINSAFCKAPGPCQPLPCLA